MSRSITVKHVEGKPGQVYYPLQINQNEKPTPGPNQVLVKLNAVSLNHRDLFVRRRLYPGISFENPLFSDGHGTVEALGPGASAHLQGKSVIMVPCRGWASSPEGPETAAFAALGGSALYPEGMGQDYLVIDESEVELAPEHLTPAEAAALPLTGLTGWRALVTKSGNAQPGRNILVTGIGGGVALQILQFGVAMGCNMFVTSGDEAKIRRARKEFGAFGGANYNGRKWEIGLSQWFPHNRRYLDAIIDGAGGDIMGRAVNLLKPGGVVVQYGMTVSPKMDWVMGAVLRNIELRGSTMGSREEYRAMVQFVREKKIRPVISKTVKGLSNLEGIEELFRDMEEGKQFGKLVIDFHEEKESQSRL